MNYGNCTTTEEGLAMVVTRMFWHALDPGRPGRGCTLTIRGDGGKLA